LVSVDPNLRPTSWPSLPAARDALEPLIREAEILKVNDQEARLLTGEEDLRAAAEHLAGGRRLILITLGADGCLWRWQGERGLVVAPAVEVVETTGAGDAFVGALLTQLTTRGYTGRRFADLVAPDLEDSLRFACAAGAIACTAAGAMSSLPTAEQVDALLHAV
jgi:fructokinase